MLTVSCFVVHAAVWVTVETGLILDRGRFAADHTSRPACRSVCSGGVSASTGRRLSLTLFTHLQLVIGLEIRAVSCVLLITGASLLVFQVSRRYRRISSVYGRWCGAVRCALNGANKRQSLMRHCLRFLLALPTFVPHTTFCRVPQEHARD